MTARELIASFDVLAEAPEGVKRLRGLVLQLAVRGRLVDQSQADEPAQALIERLKIRGGGRTNRRGAGRRTPGTPPNRAGLFDLPASWTWARFDEVAHIASNLVDPSAHSASPHVAPDCIEKGTGKLIGYRTVAEDDVLSGKHRFRAGQILYSKIRPNLSKAVLVDFDGLCSADMYPVDAFIDAGYLHRYILSSPFLEQVVVDDNRLAMPKVNQAQLSNVLVPVPPLDEQKRIVARVDELMTLLDRLEAARNAREASRKALRDAALAALQNADTQEEVEVAWNRIAERMHDLFTEPEDLAPLRQTVLELAVHGRLVPQNSGEEPASALLARAGGSMGLSRKGGRRTTPAEVAADSAAEQPHRLPHMWAWSRLGDLLSVCRNGVSVSPNDRGEGYPLLRISAATGKENGSVDMRDHRFAAIPREEASAFILQPGDLLACRYNGNLEYVGQVAQVPADHQGAVLHPDKLIRLVAPAVSHSYLRIAINSESTRRQVRKLAATTAGNIGINGKQLRSLLIPVPPRPQQDRIAAAVASLTRLADRLSEQLAAEAGAHATAAAAAVHHLSA